MTFEQFDDNREEKAQFEPLDFTPFAPNGSIDFEQKDFGSKDFGTKDLGSFGTKDAVSNVANAGSTTDLVSQDGGAKDANRKDFATQVSFDLNAQAGIAQSESGTIAKQGAGAVQNAAKGTSDEFGEKVGTKGSGSTEPVRYEKKRDDELHNDDNKIAFGGISASDNAHAASIKLSDAAYAAPRLNRSAASEDATNLVTSLGESKNAVVGNPGDGKSGAAKVVEAKTGEVRAVEAKVVEAKDAKSTVEAVPELKVAKEFAGTAAEVTSARQASVKELGSARETRPELTSDLAPGKLFEKPIQFTEATKLKAPEVTNKEFQVTQTSKGPSELQGTQPSKGHSEFPSNDVLLESMKTKAQIQKSDSATVEQMPRTAELTKQQLQSFESPLNKQSEQGVVTKTVANGETTRVHAGEASKPNEPTFKTIDNIGVKQNVVADTKLGAAKNESFSAAAVPLKLDVNKVEAAPSKVEAGRELVNMRTSEKPALAEPSQSGGEAGKAKSVVANAKDLSSQIAGQRNIVGESKVDALAKSSSKTADAISQPKFNAFRESVPADSNIKTLVAQSDGGMKKQLEKGVVSEARTQNLETFRKDTQGITTSGANESALRKGIGSEMGKPINSQPAENIKTRATNLLQQIDSNKSFTSARNLETQKQIPSNTVERNPVNQTDKITSGGGGGFKGESSLVNGAAGSGVKAIQEPLNNGGTALAKAAAADKITAADKFQPQIGRPTEADLAKMKVLGGEKASSSEPIKTFSEPGKGPLGRDVNGPPKDVTRAVDQVTNKGNNFGPAFDAKRTEKPNAVDLKSNGIEGNTKLATRTGAEAGQRSGEQAQRLTGEPKTSTTQRIVGEQARSTEFAPKLNQPAKEVQTQQSLQKAGGEPRGPVSIADQGQKINSLKLAGEQAQRAANVTTDKGSSEQVQKHLGSQGKPSNQVEQPNLSADLGKKLAQDQSLPKNQRLPQDQKMPLEQKAPIEQKLPQDQKLAQNQKLPQEQNLVQEQKPVPDQSSKSSIQTAQRNAIEQTQKPIENSIRAAAESTVPRSNVNLRGSVEAGKVVDAGKVVEQGKSTPAKANEDTRANEGVKTRGAAKANEAVKSNDTFKANDSARPNEVAAKSVDATRRAEVGGKGLDVNPKSPETSNRSIDGKPAVANRAVEGNRTANSAVDVNGRAVVGNFKAVDSTGKSIDVNGKSFESKGKLSDGNFKLETTGKPPEAGKVLDSRVSSIINATNRRAVDGQPDAANVGKRNQQVEPTAKQAEPRAKQFEVGSKQAEAVSNKVETRPVEAGSKYAEATSKQVEAASRQTEPGSKLANSKQFDQPAKQIESGAKQIDSGGRQLEPGARAEMSTARGHAFTAVKFGEVDVTAELKGTTLANRLEAKKVGLGGTNTAEVRANVDVMQGSGGRFNSDGKWISTTSVPVGRGDSNRYMTGLELALVLSIAGIAKYSGGDHRGYRMEGKIWSIANRHGETLIYVDGRKNPFKVSRSFEAGQANAKTDAASAIGKTIATAIKPFHIGSTLKGDTANGANAKGENVGKQVKAQNFVVVNGQDFGKSAKMSTLTMSGVERLGTTNVTDKMAGRNAQGTMSLDTMGKIAQFNVRQAITAADFYGQNRSRYPGGFELAMVMTAAGLTRGTALDTVLNKPLDSTSGPADRSKWLSSNNHSSTPTGRGVFDGIAFGATPTIGEQSKGNNNNPFGDRYQEFLDRIDSYTKKYAQEAVMTGSTFAPTNFIVDNTDELDEEADEALDKPEEEEAAPNASGNVETVLRRPMWMIAPGETLDGIAEVHYGNADLGWLIADLNMHVIRQTYIDGKRVVELRSRQQIELPVKEDIEKFHKNRKKEQSADNLITVVVERTIDREVVEQSIGRVIGAKDSTSAPLPNTGLQIA